MPIRAQLFDGTILEFPDGTDQSVISRVAREQTLLRQPKAEPPPATPEPPKPEGGFFPSVKRGFLQTGMLLGDVLPAMVGKAVGAEEYAKRQWEEAAETQKRIEREVPAGVASYKDISGFGDAWTYAKEAVGESLVSIIPSLITGGVAGILARPAVAAANTAAREAAEKTLMSAAMKMGPPTEVALESAKKAAIQAGIDAAKRTAFRYEVAGGFAGSAAQNIPEVYQNIKEETGKEEIPAALIAGGFNAALDTILPAQLLKKIRGQGLSDTEVMAAWYKRGAKGLGKGFLTEGATEAAQEASSILAENFVAENSDVFNGKNLERVLNAGLKGGLGGGVITAATDIATGKAPPKELSDREQIERLQKEILGDVQQARAEQTLQEAENAKEAAVQAEEARKEAERAPTVSEIFSMAQGPNGYSALETEKQRLIAQERKTKDVKDAIEVIKETQNRLVTEEFQRRAPPAPAVMDDQTIRSLGFAKSDKETSVYQQLLGKSAADPEVTAFLQNYADTKARPQTKERITKFLGAIERSQIPLTAEEVARGEERVGETLAEPSGIGAPVAGEPGAGAPAAGAGVTQPSGVVRPVAPVGEPPVGEGAKPAPVAAPPVAPPVAAPAPPPPVATPAAPLPTPVAPPVIQAAPVVQPEKPVEAVKQPKGPTERQERVAFGTAIGAAQNYPGSLAARVNRQTQAAVEANDFPGVVAALQKSKSPVVAEVANRARGLSTNIVIDEEAGEQYAQKSPILRQLSIDGAKMHLDALEKIRQLAPQVDALPDGSVLPYSITGEKIAAIDGGKDAGSMPLSKMADMGTTMFAQFPKINLNKKEDFKAFQKAFEDITNEVGENNLRMTSTGSAQVTGVAGAYDPGTNTIRVPSYFAKNEGVLAHEIVHAQTLNSIASPTNRQKPIVARLNKLYEHVKKELEARAEKANEPAPYGVSSIQEFMAEGMSNPRFQFLLTKVKYKNQTAWDAFVEAIANLIGVKKDTAFTELLSIYSQLVPPPAATVAEAAPQKAKIVTQPKAKKPPKTVMGSPLLALVNRFGGLDPSLLSEFSTRVPTKRIGRDGRPMFAFRNPPTSMGQFFRIGGKGDYEEIARMLEENGYLEPGSVESNPKDAGERAKDLIKAALGREEVLTLEEQVAEESRLREELDREEQARMDEAAEIQRQGQYPELDTESAMYAEQDRLALIEELGFDPNEINDLTDDEVPFDLIDAADDADIVSGMRERGFSQKEIQEVLDGREKEAGIVKAPEGKPQKAEEAPAAGKAAPGALKPSLPEVEPLKPVKLSKETEAKIERLGGLLKKMLGKMGLKNVALNIVQDLQNNGEYANRLIKLALDATNPVRDLRHEGLHAMKELGFFSDAQWQTLSKMAKDKWIEKYLKKSYTTYEGQPMTRYDAYMRLYNSNEEMIIEEAIADAFGDFDATKPPAGFLNTMLFRMREFFRNIREAMGAANIDTAEDIFRRVEKGELKETAPAVDASATEAVNKASLRGAGFESFDKDYPTPDSVADGFRRGELVVHARTKDDTDFRYGIEPSIGELVKSTEAYQEMIERYGEAPELTFFSDNTSNIDSWAKFFAKRDAPVQMVFVRKTDSMQKSLGNGKVMTSDGRTMSYEMSPLADYENELMRAEPAFVETGDWYTDKDQDVVAVMDYAPAAKPSLRDVPKVDRDRSLNEMRVSPRLPTAVKATENPLAKSRLQPDIETFERDPVAFRHNIGLMSKYPNFSNVKGTPAQRAEQMVEQMKDNLLWLFNNWKPDLRERSRLWYVGGNRISHRWAEKYGIPPEQAAAIIASLSPQKDWFQNVSLAERTLDALVFNADTAWTPQMTQVFRDRAWAKKFPLGKYQGKTLKEMYRPGDAKSLVDMAVWIRAWDEATNPQTARVITPEGTFTNEIAAGKTGKPIAMRAQSFAAMVKTLQIMQQPDLKAISDLIGKNHKVRSFYNNIIAPYAGDDVTIDTHAVAAALMRPLGSSDLEVYHNFGSAKPAKKDKEGNILVPASPGTKNSAITGLYGTYAMYAEAYRRAAKEAGVLPREMQSITWEAIRGLFRPEQKQARLKQQTNVLWNKVARGEISANAAREQISSMVSGIEDPAWVRSPAGANESRTDSSYASELPGVGIPRGRPAEPAGRTGERVARAVPRFSLRDRLGLYSELENRIEQIGPKAAPAAQWKTMINALVQKGVKPDEIQWSGVNDWLDLQTGRVSKDDLLNYLKQGGVKVEETVLGTQARIIEGRDAAMRSSEMLGYDSKAEALTALKADYRRMGDADKVLDQYDLNDTERSQLKAWLDAGDMSGDRTKYGQYTLPGGENYREVLLTLPDKDANRLYQLEIKVNGGNATLAERQEYADLIDSNRGKGAYRSNHWEQANVLAHIRMNDRTDANGNKVLFVEEIQSDWGQEGKKKGFALTEAQRKALQPGSPEAILALGRGALGDMTVDVQEQGFAPMQQTLRGPAFQGLPVAPFVTKTEGWLNLALKRIMVMAAEGGYDKVAFVNGEQSADRYDLSKQISRITVYKKSDGGFGISAEGMDGNLLPAQDVKDVDALEGIVGKELAVKIADQKRSVERYEGLDLKVGGEGMKTFYDTIVPTALKKLLPKVGGGQMGDVQIQIPGATNRIDRPRMESLQQPGFDVTPAMQDKVQTTGLPRFSLRDIPRANLRDQLDPDIRGRIDQTTVPREEKSFAKRITEALSPENFSVLRQRALNRYEGLSRLDRLRVEQMGGADLLADASAESAALLSDMGAGITASALGVHDRKGGAPVYKRTFVVQVGNRVLAKQYKTRAAAESAASAVNGVVRERGFTTVSSFDDSVKGPVAIFAPLMAKYKDAEIFRLFQFYSGVKRGSRFMFMLDKDGNVVEKLFEPGDIARAKRLELEYPEFKTVHADWIKYNDKLVDYMRDTGVISEQNAETFKMHGDYFPFYRQMNGEEDAIGPRIFQSISAVKPPKKLKGSEFALGDFMENMVRNTQAAVQAGVKNVAARRAAELGMDVGLVSPIPPNVTPMAANSFYVLENGLKKYYDTSDHLLIESIKSLNLPDLPFIGMLAGPANLLRNLVTKDPGFILANLMRDSMSAWATSGVKMMPIAATVANFGKALGTKSPEFEALLNAGVIGGYEFSQNVQTSAKEFGASIRKAAGVPTATEQIAKPITSLWGALEKATMASDAATRMEVYKKTLAETGNEAEAIYRALEVMNFNRKGSSAVIRILTAGIPFLNARMQGLDILYRAAIAPSVRGSASDRAKEVQKAFFVRGAMIMAISAMYWALTHDDEEYKKQEQETRDNYWLLPSLGIKIPIPFEVGVLFKVIPERILAYTMGTDTGKDFLASMKRQLLSTLAFNPIPQVAVPIIETATNFSFFTQRNIVPQGLENVAPEYQIGPGTSKLAEGIGSVLKQSPMKIDQLINGYTGTMGMYAVDLIDAIYNTMADSPKASKRFEQLPVIRRFAVDPEARGTVTAYYDLKNSVDQVVRTENLLERTMNYEDYGPYMQENIKLFAARDYVNDMEKTLKELREMKTFIRASNMSADSKRDAIKAIGQFENSLTSNIQQLKKAFQ